MDLSGLIPMLNSIHPLVGLIGGIVILYVLPRLGVKVPNPNPTPKPVDPLAPVAPVIPERPVLSALLALLQMLRAKPADLSPDEHAVAALLVKELAPEKPDPK